MNKTTKAGAWALAASMIFGVGCADKAEIVRPKQQNIGAALGDVKCTPELIAAPNGAQRFVVDWNDGDREALEVEMEQGVALVKYTCDGIQVTVRDQKDISTELRLVSTTDGPLSWSVGAYYLHINRHYGVAVNEDTGQGSLDTLYNPPGSINPTSQLFDDKLLTDAYAAFGSLQYKPTDKLTVSGALRYDREERKVEPLVPNVIDPVTGGPPGAHGASGAQVVGKRAGVHWSHQPARRTMAGSRS